jgi:hypothetical protein
MVGSEKCLVKPSRILSIGPVSNSDPPNVPVELMCSLCDEVEIVVVNLNEPGDLSWLRRHDFYFVCGRHRQWTAN